jgi:hypothetical protein
MLSAMQPLTKTPQLMIRGAPGYFLCSNASLKHEDMTENLPSSQSLFKRRSRINRRHEDIMDKKCN